MFKTGEIVKKLNTLPQPSIGAPLPSIISDEHNFFLIYILEEHNPNWDGTSIEVLDRNSEKKVAVFNFKSTRAHKFGPPNDEAFSGHPLYKKGLRPYSIFEIENSKWISELEKMNSVHPRHSKQMFKDLKHYIFAFHDSTLEVICESFEYSIIQKTISQAMKDALGDFNKD